MNAIRAAIAKLIATIKAEPAVTTGGVVGAVAAAVTWAQTNQITTLRQLVSFALPVAVTFFIRTFVTPTSKVALTVVQAEALRAANAAPAKSSTAPSYPPAAS